MNRYVIEQTESGVVLFDGLAASSQDALDRMARDAGYSDFAATSEFGGRDTLLVTGPFIPPIQRGAIKAALDTDATERPTSRDSRDSGQSAMPTGGQRR